MRPAAEAALRVERRQRERIEELEEELAEALERIEELEHELRTVQDNPGYIIEDGIYLDED